ncbi:MAG: hypothetical protein ABIK09_06555 [Pseudomonadota bacterium]
MKFIGRLRILTVLLSLLLLPACGGGGGGSGDSDDDVTRGEDVPLQEFCLANPGEECDDDDPCTLGPGICISGECIFEDVTDCGPVPDSCSANPTCDGEGGCIWKIAPGWCRIDGECRDDGQTQAANGCLRCVPDESRTSWTPVSGFECFPADNPCTTNGTCAEGFCVPNAIGVECASDPDCASADDGDLCNGVWTCEDCQCVLDPGSVITCDTGGDTQCAMTGCDPATGQCIPMVQPNGIACEDGDPCTNGDTCQAGECTSGAESDPVWTPLPGPVGAWLDAVVRLPGNPSPMLAVGRGGGVYRSLDGGTTWSLGDLLGWGEERGDWLIVGHGGIKPVLVIYGNSLFRSLDGGVQWSEAMAGCEAVTEAAGLPGSFLAACNGKTYFSQDGGATWPQSGGNLPGSGNREVVALAAADAATWYVGTRNEDGAGRGKVYRTGDSGASWAEVSLPSLPDPVAVSRHGLLVDPSATTRVFAGLSRPDGTAFQFGETALYRSQDAGANWEPLAPSSLGSTLVPLTLDSIGRLLVGVDKTLARGGNYGSGPWAFIPAPPIGSPVQLHGITQALIDPTNEFSFYVPAANGLAFAKDLGQTWVLYDKGLRSGRYNTLMVASTGTLLAADPDGGRVLRSTNEGATWEAAALSLDGDNKILASLGEAADGRLFGLTTEGGLVKSDSDGADWIHLDPDTNPLFTACTAIGAPTPEGAGQGRVLAFMDGVGLWRNDNGAIPGVEAAWTLSNLAVRAATDLVPLLDSSTVLFLSTPRDPNTGTARIFRTTDAGNNWDPVASADGDGFRLFPHPGNGSYAFAGLLGDLPKLYQTTNSGASWSPMPKQPTFANVRSDGGLLEDPAVAGGLYAALWLSGIWKFDPEAGVWALLEGSPETAISLAEDPTAPGRILAADGADAVLWASEDGGETWQVEEDFGASFTRIRKVVGRPGVTAVLLDGPEAGEGSLRLRTGAAWFAADDLPGGAWDLETYVHPETEQTTLLAAGEGGGLYRSSDMGVSWQPVGGYPDTASYDIEVSANGGTILATSECGLEGSVWPSGPEATACGVIRSTDDGATWAQMLSLERSCAALVFDPVLPAQAWAACPGSGLYQTSTAGANWQNVSSDVGLLTSLPLAFSDVTTFDGRLALGSAVTGVYLTQPGSTTTWVTDATQRPQPRLEAVRIDADKANENRILVSALPGGIYLTEDNGNHWFDVGGALAPEMGWGSRLPINAAFIHSDGADPAFGDGVHLWAAVEGAGLWTAGPGLWRWSQALSGLPTMNTAHPYTLVEAAGGILGDLRIWLLATEGVFRSTNGGLTWQSISAGLPPGDLLAFAPPAGPNMFASVSGRQVFWASGDGAAWAKAETIRPFKASWPLWSNRRVGFWSWISADTGVGNRVTLSIDPTGLWRTEDGGLTWDPYGRGLPQGGTYAVLGDQDAPGSLFVGTEDGPYLATDGEDFFPIGENWVPQWGAPVEFYQDPALPDRIFAVTEGSTQHGIPEFEDEETLYPSRSLVRTEDRGDTWVTSGEGIPMDSGPLQILADPSAEGVYFLATAKAGTLRSSDGGSSWAPWNTGLPGPRTGAYGQLRGRPMALSTDGERLILGTSGFGLFERTLSSTCED